MGRENRSEAVARVVEPEPEAVSGGAVDWKSLVDLLSAHDVRPIVVLDREGRIQHCNGRFATLLGWRMEQLSGLSCEESGLPEEARTWGDPSVSAVPRGTRTVECVVATRDRRRMKLGLELSRIGSGDSAGVLGVVTAMTQLEGPRADRLLRYEISSRVQDFGTVLRVPKTEGECGTPEVKEGRRCFETLHHRETPCAGCPVLAREGTGWPRTAVLRPAADGGRFHIVTAEPVDDTSVRMTVQFLSDGTFSQLVRAKLQSLADTAKLSERERLVLELLVGGFSLQEIAQQLSISARTVKFHQANVLHKLKVESRIALLRLLF
jgi:PAS domain S-box-containing protein